MSRLSLDLPRIAEPVQLPTKAADGRGFRHRLAGALPLAGFPVRSTRSDRLARFLHRRLQDRRKLAVGFVNQNFVVTCKDLGRGACPDDGVILVNDGIGMQLAALLRFGRRFRENMNGTDFVPRFLREAGRPLTVFLIGSEPQVIARTAAVIGALPHCRVVGTCDGFSLWQREAEVLDEVAAAKPDVLLVGLGNPVQERWIVHHWERLDATLIFGVGALFEWWSGHRRRAPLAVRQMRLEWLYRLALEPRRLCHRYTLGILTFFALVLLRPVSRVPTEAAR